MSFSSGAYFGSHSRVSQGRAASAFVVSLLVWIGPLSRTATRGRVRSAVPYAAPSWSSRATKSGGALGGAGMDEKAPVHRIKGAEHRPLFRLTGGLDAQLGAAPGPAARQIGMCERFGFVEEHQIDRPRRGLGFQISEALAAGRDRGCILAPFERVARPPPGKPLWRNWCESHRGEIVGPPRRAISAQGRGSAQPLSWRVSSVRIVAAIAAAGGPILACCPGRGRRRSPAPPPCAK